MKRQLSVQHLLYNAVHKPTYVRDWCERLQVDGTICQATEQDEAFMRRYTWRCFAEGESPAIRELDFGRNAFAPTLFTTQCEGLLSISILFKVRLAFTQANSRYLDWHEAYVSYDPASVKYRLSLEDRDDLPSSYRGVVLTTADRTALDLFVESTVRLATKGI